MIASINVSLNHTLDSMGLSSLCLCYSKLQAQPADKDPEVNLDSVASQCDPDVFRV